MKYYVGIDLGGTNIVAGVVDEEYNIITKASTKTMPIAQYRTFRQTGVFLTSGCAFPLGAPA